MSDNVTAGLPPVTLGIFLLFWCEKWNILFFPSFRRIRWEGISSTLPSLSPFLTLFTHFVFEVLFFDFISLLSVRVELQWAIVNEDVISCSVFCVCLESSTKKITTVWTSVWAAGVVHRRPRTCSLLLLVSFHSIHGNRKHWIPFSNNSKHSNRQTHTTERKSQLESAVSFFQGKRKRHTNKDGLKKVKRCSLEEESMMQVIKLMSPCSHGEVGSSRFRVTEQPDCYMKWEQMCKKKESQIEEVGGRWSLFQPDSFSSGASSVTCLHAPMQILMTHTSGCLPILSVCVFSHASDNNRHLPKRDGRRIWQDYESRAEG